MFKKIVDGAIINDDTIRHNGSCLCPRPSQARPGQARIDYLAPLFDDNTIILKNDDRRFIVLLTEYLPCTYFHKNNKSQLDIPFVLEFRKRISLTALFALTVKNHEKFRGLHTVTAVCPAFLIDGRFLSELRGSLFYFLFRLFEPELTVLPTFLLFAACTSVATCMFFNFMTRTTFIAKKRRKKFN